MLEYLSFVNMATVTVYLYRFYSPAHGHFNPEEIHNQSVKIAVIIQWQLVPEIDGTILFNAHFVSIKVSIKTLYLCTVTVSVLVLFCFFQKLGETAMLFKLKAGNVKLV